MDVLLNRWMIEKGRILAAQDALSLGSLYLLVLFWGNTGTPHITGWVTCCFQEEPCAKAIWQVGYLNTTGPGIAHANHL